jgi:uncharacterized protein YcfL
MKKAIFVTSLMALALSSCKKTYTCNCTDNSKLKMENTSKKSAEESCDELETNSAKITSNTTCTLTSE